VVAEWRQRHDILVRRHDEMSRRDRLAGAPLNSGTSASHTLLASSKLWPRLVAHPFVRSVADGDLSAEVFRRRIVNDHYYNVEYQRFIAGLAGIAPSDAARESLATAISGSRLGLIEIRRLADQFLIDLTAEPESATVGLAAYLQAQVTRGYELSLTALYAAEMVYFDTWSAISPEADKSTPYWGADRLLVLHELRTVAGQSGQSSRRRSCRWPKSGDASGVQLGDAMGALVLGRASRRRHLLTGRSDRMWPSPGQLRPGKAGRRLGALGGVRTEDW
jgi:TENA/THI-4/PQQC family